MISVNFDRTGISSITDSLKWSNVDQKGDDVDWLRVYQILSDYDELITGFTCDYVVEEPGLLYTRRELQVWLTVEGVRNVIENVDSKYGRGRLWYELETLVNDSF